jgi:hypothetical protein
MPFWGMVAAADAYAKGDREKSIHTSVHSGYSTTISTFLSKTKQWRKEMPSNISTELSNISKFVCCLDNNQKGYPLKYQRNRASNRFIKVTAICIKDCIEVSPLYDLIENTTALTYYNQPVPSPLGMAKYDIIMSDIKSLIIKTYSNVLSTHTQLTHMTLTYSMMNHHLILIHLESASVLM